MNGFGIGADLFPLLAAVLAALTCGLLGNFLVLRRLSLMGDAISHSVLPGLVIAFLIAASRSPLVMFLGAAVAGVATVVLVELVKRLGRVEPGAAMGVVFSVLFALGVLLIRQVESLGNIDLDADCVLHGQLETLAWFGAPDSWSDLLSPATLGAVPRQVWTLLGMFALASVFVAALFKELRLAAFDPALATSQGFSAPALHYALMVLVAGATVASFEAVGSILVIAMLICPAAAARLLTDRLLPQIAVSLLAALVAAAGGYLGATAVPGAFGLGAVNAAGSMSVAAGVLVAGAVVASPRHGLVSSWLRRRALALSVARDDLLAGLYRAAESGAPTPAHTGLSAVRMARASGSARRAGLLSTGEPARLTPAGEHAAREVVRRHRLWEHYLVEEAGLAPDHVHPTAEKLEHTPLAPAGDPATDPHGRPIPPALAPDPPSRDIS
ncbi:MAG: metal ABC transporter permease [Phycisphaerales bacterium]|nr:metal ABC transporter permease [Phycisphaerales bacterium]